MDYGVVSCAAKNAVGESVVGQTTCDYRIVPAGETDSESPRPAFPSRMT